MRRIFVTGAAQGIGASIVKEFVKAGDKVAFCDIQDEKGAELAKSLGENCFFYKCDVTDAAALQNVLNTIFEAWGDIDVIVNNVGYCTFIPIIEQTIEQFDKQLATNLRPVYITSRALAIHRSKQAEKNPYGRIINICSTRFKQSEPGTEGYAASKGGVFSITHSLAMSLSEYNITVNSIAPGWIQNTDYDKLTEADHLQHPSKRVGHPEDISRMVLFICQKENDFINAENIVIDGGMTKKMIYVE